MEKVEEITKEETRVSTCWDAWINNQQQTRLLLTRQCNHLLCVIRRLRQNAEIQTRDHMADRPEPAEQFASHNNGGLCNSGMYTVQHREYHVRPKTK